jgi:hypothetical protein
LFVPLVTRPPRTSSGGTGVAVSDDPPLVRLSDRVLDVAQALLGAALNPSRLAADVLLRVPGQLAERFLELAPSLAERALDVLHRTRHGMVFSEVAAYFIILATGATPFVAGETEIAARRLSQSTACVAIGCARLQ